LDTKTAAEKVEANNKVASRLSHKIKDTDKKDGVFMTALG
jgi:hypothetical protein